jgi:hypothetical protein
MSYVLAIVCLGVALLFGALDLLGITPGAAGIVTLSLLMAVILMGVQGLLNYSHNHHRRQVHHH